MIYPAQVQSALSDNRIQIRDRTLDHVRRTLGSTFFANFLLLKRNFSYLMQNDELLESMGLLKDIQEIMNSLDQNDFKII